MDAELSGIYTRLLELEKRADAQERSIQLIAYFAETADHGFKVYVQEKINEWSDISDRNETTSEEEKERAQKNHEAMLRLLLPGKPPTISRA